MKRLGIRVLCSILCAAMIPGLAACGNSQSQSSRPQNSPEAPTQSAPAATPAAAPGTFVWKSEFRDVGSGEGSALQPVLFTEDGCYAVDSVLIGRREALPGEVEEYEGQFDIYSTGLYFIDWEGKVSMLPGFKPDEPPANTENKKDFYSASEFSSLARTADGKLMTVITRSAGWFDGPDSAYNSDDEDDDAMDYYRYEQSYVLVTMDADGTELSRAQIAVDDENMWFNTDNIAADPEGNLILMTGESLDVYAPDGSLVWSIANEEGYSSLVTLRDGGVGAVVYGDRGMEYRPVDFDARQLGEATAIPEEAWTMIPGDDAQEFLYLNGLYLYGFQLGAEKPEQLLNWLNCDINGDTLSARSIYMREDGSIVGLTGIGSDEETQYQLFTLTRIPAESAPKKVVLTVAQLDPEPDLQLTTAMLRFNRSHENIRLEYADYSRYNTDSDDTAGLTKFNTEAMAGKLPDIIPTGQIAYRQFAAKGLLEDLYPYLDADRELKREDFFPNLLAAMEVGGGLYQMVPGFSVETLSGAASIVGDTPGWTYDEFNAALAKMPEGCLPLDPGITRDQVLSALLSADMDSYVDWSSGKVSFDSEGFRQMLEFVRQFPEEYVSEEEGMSDDAQELVRQGRQMLLHTELYGLDSILWNDLNFGGKATFIGWPTTSGVGSIMRIGSGFAISKTCADKEAAWEFLRSMLTADGQKNSYIIPSNRNAFNAQLKEYMTPIYRKDANGNYVLDENGERIQESRGGWADETGDHSIYAMTQEQADEILEVISTCTKVANYDTSVFDIVYAEAQAYFMGQKTLDDVVRMIQSKVNLYVNEQR